MAPTLAYDDAVMGDSTVPAERYRCISAPTLVLAGSESPAWMRQAARAVAAAIPLAGFDVLDGQDHDVAPEALSSAVAEFRGIR
jgi:hypothetical protein